MGCDAPFEGMQFLEDVNAVRMWLGVATVKVGGWASDQAAFTPEIPEAVAAFAEKRGFTPEWFLVLDVG